MKRKPFTFSDLQAECRIETECYSLDGRRIGARVFVPTERYTHYPYNASAYVFLQYLRQAIFEYGTIEFPDLPLNKTNHTVAMRHPRQHHYSNNPYLNSFFQQPHQDTPPYPTAFWLDHPRRYSATWVISMEGLQQWSILAEKNPGWSTEAIHRQLVAKTLADGSGLLFTQNPGLFLFDNSERQQLYHARTCNFSATEENPDHREDTPAYAFNEIGLLNYIDTLDSRRGHEDRDDEDLQAVKAFIAQEQLAPFMGEH